MKTIIKQHLKKRKKVYSLLVGIVMLFATLFGATAYNGDGSLGNPYQIYTCNELFGITDTTAHYKLMNNINCKDVSITSTIPSFSGNFNGQGFGIYDIIKTNGVFSSIANGGIVTNFTIWDSDFTGTSLGALANSLQEADVSYIGIINTDVTGTQNMGGITGSSHNRGLHLYRSYTINGTFYNDGSGTGGIMFECGDAVTVGSDLIEECFTDGSNILTKSWKHQNGGVLYRVAKGCTLKNVYSNSEVTYCGSSGYCGGVSGVAETGSRIEYSYASGYVKSASNSGGLSGPFFGTSVDNFYDMNTTTYTSSYTGTGKTTSEMYQQSTYSNWDFTNTWQIDEGNSYPELKWFTMPIKGCAPQWNCTEYETCQSDDTKGCSILNDIYSCGVDYNGTYTEWISQCDYCVPNFLLNETWSKCTANATNISGNQYKNYIDQNNCFSQTGLQSDSNNTLIYQNCTYIEPVKSVGGGGTAWPENKKDEISLDDIEFQTIPVKHNTLFSVSGLDVELPKFIEDFIMMIKKNWKGDGL